MDVRNLAGPVWHKAVQRLIGSCLDLASPTRGLHHFACSSSAGAPCLWLEQHRIRFIIVIYILEYVMQDTIEALMRAPDVMKSLRDVLRKIKDVPKLLQRLQVKILVRRLPRPASLKQASSLRKLCSSMGIAGSRHRASFFVFTANQKHSTRSSTKCCARILNFGQHSPAAWLQTHTASGGHRV